MTMLGMGGWMNSLLVLAWGVYVTVADQIVYLERPSGGPTWEPFFNPKTVNANIGEKISFIARFSPLIHDSTSEVFASDIPIHLYPYLFSSFSPLLTPLLSVKTLPSNFGY
jgi:hypothetical protein